MTKIFGLAFAVWLERRGRLALALVSAVGLAGCDDGEEGNGERAQESRELSAFSRVRSDCELYVEVVQGEEQTLRLSLDSNLLEYVRTRVENDTLYLDVSEDLGEMVSGPHVRITLPRLSAAKLAGSGEMRLRFDQPELPLDVYLSGSGDLRFNGRAAAVGAFLTGSGDIELSGETSDAELGLTGSGDIDARQLSALSADIELSGSGDVSATVTDSTRIALSGSGDVDLYGGSAVEIREESGSGDINGH